MTDKVARHQGDKEVDHAYVSRAANLCSWFERSLFQPTLLLFLGCCLLRFSLCFFSSYFLPGSIKPSHTSRVTWVDDEPVGFVLYCLTPRGEA